MRLAFFSFRARVIGRSKNRTRFPYCLVGERKAGLLPGRLYHLNMYSLQQPERIVKWAFIRKSSSPFLFHPRRI